MSAPVAASLVRGRHRWGRPGLVHVSAFVTVRRRSVFVSWLYRLRRREQRRTRHAFVGVPA